MCLVIRMYNRERSRRQFLTNIHIIDINDAKIDRENSGLTIDHFIKLDTPDKALIDQIAKVICYDEKLYILTTIPYNSVYIFSSKGAFYINSQMDELIMN